VLEDIDIFEIVAFLINWFCPVFLVPGIVILVCLYLACNRAYPS
jgi:hypothetical protein